MLDLKSDHKPSNNGVFGCSFKEEPVRNQVSIMIQMKVPKMILIMLVMPRMVPDTNEVARWG